jgi:hypothetical protein
MYAGVQTATTHASGAQVTLVLTDRSLRNAFARADQNNALTLKANSFEATSGGVQTDGAGGSFDTASRFVGAMSSSGPPSSGTFNANDYGFDTNGICWLCATGGSPGTWIPISGWIKWSSTFPSGFSSVQIPIPSGFGHAKFFWRAIDTASGTNAQFVNMQVATQGGLIDSAAHYNWAYTSSAGIGIGNNASQIPAGISTAAGLSPDVAAGEITIPFYSAIDMKIQILWQSGQSNFGDQRSHSGSAIAWGVPNGPLTAVRFFIATGTWTAATQFDLMMHA